MKKLVYFPPCSYVQFECSVSSFFQYFECVRHTTLRRIRGPSYLTLEAQTSRIVKATPPSGAGFGTIGHQPSSGKWRPLTESLRLGTHLVTPYTSRLSNRFLLAGYMRGDLRVPDASGSNSIGRRRIKLQTPKVSWLESVSKVTGRIYAS